MPEEFPSRLDRIENTLDRLAESQAEANQERRADEKVLRTIVAGLAQTMQNLVLHHSSTTDRIDATIAGRRRNATGTRRSPETYRRATKRPHQRGGRNDPPSPHPVELTG